MVDPSPWRFPLPSPSTSTGETLLQDTLVVSFDDARGLASEFGTPLLCFSKSRLQTKYRELQRALPGVQIYYAVKANPHPEIIRTLVDLNSRFDVATMAEYDAIRAAGVQSEHVLYTHPIKRHQEIVAASQANLAGMILDNTYEARKVAQYAPGSNVMIRLSESNTDAMVNLSYKFGVGMEEALELATLATQLGLHVTGVCFHVGSQNVNPYHFVDGIVRARLVIDEMNRLGMNVTVLDIGGGFPIPYTHDVLPIYDFCEPIRHALRRHAKGLTVICEPGRYLVGDSVSLVTSVIGKAQRDGKMWYYLDDGIYNSFSGIVYEQCHYTLFSHRSENPHECVIAGPTCDSHDIIFSQATMPELDVDDIILVGSMGAYTSCSATEFNGYAKAAWVTLD